jgi:SAM-dependent methyltransferase
MNENKTIKEVYRVLKPNGKLIFSVPYKGMFRFLDPFNMKYYLPGLYKWFKGKAYNPNIYKEAPWHRHYTLNELKGYFKGRFEIEKKHRGGLFLYPFCALLFDSIFWKLKNTPKFILNFIDAIGKLDYMISYGPLAYHITLRAICVKKK